MPKSKDTLRLENQLCFPLYACSREIVKKYKPFLDPLNLTYTQYVVMMVMWEEKEVTAKRLGERLYLDSGTLTPLLKRLEKDGLVSRARSAEDERSLIVTLTDQGQQLKQKALAVPEQAGACLKLGPEDAATLYKLLYQVLEG